MKIKKTLQAELIWAYAKPGGFQRSQIYESTATKAEKEIFRSSLKDFLFQNVFTAFYNKRVSEMELIQVLDFLILRNKQKAYLKGGELRFGNAQKFVNLYLKGMWVAGFLDVPPHFPVDRVMINRLGISQNWTNMNKKQYENIICVAKLKIGIDNEYMSIAEWEAEEYQRSYIAK
ncbi:MAG: hypothetical protein U0T79_11235 [Ferruginibacter sp.]